MHESAAPCCPLLGHGISQDLERMWQEISKLGSKLRPRLGCLNAWNYLKLYFSFWWANQAANPQDCVFRNDSFYLPKWLCSTRWNQFASSFVQIWLPHHGGRPFLQKVWTIFCFDSLWSANTSFQKQILADKFIGQSFMFVRGVIILYHPNVEILLADVFGQQGHAASHCIGMEELYKSQGKKEKQKLQKKRRRKKDPDGCEMLKRCLWQFYDYLQNSWKGSVMEVAWLLWGKAKGQWPMVMSDVLKCLEALVSQRWRSGHAWDL